MATVHFTSALNRFYPDLQPTEVIAGTVSEVLNELNDRYAGIQDYLVSEDGSLRKHVNVFIGGEIVKDRKNLSDFVKSGDKVHIIQALSGG